MKLTLLALAVLPALAACASSGEEAAVVPRAKPKVAKAGLLGAPALPAERDGVPVESTGAIMFVCSESPRHEDKEVFLSKCPSCSEQNYFYWDAERVAFVCYACTKEVASSTVKCPECGRPPRVVRTKPGIK